jgi:plasmid stability protein
MKNVTITLDEEVLRWAKVWAARHDTSVSRMLGEELRRKMLSEKQYERARRRFLAKRPVLLKPANTPYPSRDSLYEH